MDRVAAIEHAARARHARWNPVLWQELVAGPAVTLAQSLGGASAAHADAVLESWLRLAGEGVGLGLLSTAAEPPNVSSLLLVQAVPAQLAALPETERLPALAQAWNLGEALEREPGWKRALFLRLCRDARIDALPALVDDLERRASEPPARALDGVPAVHWVHLAADDPRFLPGAVHFVSPTVCCVHDRLRGDDGAPVALGVWLADDPVLLGGTACAEPHPAAKADRRLQRAAAEVDARVTDVVASARNEHRAALVLETSQFLVGLLPA